MIDSKDGTIRGIFSRVDLQMPGTPCVMCWGVVDPIRVAQAQLPRDELEARRREGYALELDDPDPASYDRLCEEPPNSPEVSAPDERPPAGDLPSEPF